jgi:GAF domain-containing protein
MRQGLIRRLGTWWRSNRGELDACRRELSEALEREAATARELRETRDQQTATSRELSDSLEREKATSEVLGIISSSPSDLEPVFKTILANATRLCEATYGTLFLCEGEATRLVARHGAVPAALAAERPPGAVVRSGPKVALARAVSTRQTVHVPDRRASQAYLDRDPMAVAAVELGGIRTLVVVPMLKDDELVGVISIYRQEVRPFTDKQIALVTNFASQAVIAIENARLLNELRDRTAELSESLEQQTATSQVLGVISSSPGDLRPVFQTILANATRICGANFGFLYRYDGHLFHAEATQDVAPAFADYLRREPGLAADLVRRQVSVIAAPGTTPAAIAAKAATDTIPIVIFTAGDPVALGFVATLNRPGGNVTGTTSLAGELAPKRLGLLHELLPTATAMALLVNPTNPTLAESTAREVQAAARILGLQLHILHASTEGDFDTVFATMLQLKATALVIAVDSFFTGRRERLAALALRYGLPAIYQSREFAAAGGVITQPASRRRSARWRR